MSNNREIQIVLTGENRLGGPLGKAGDALQGFSNKLKAHEASFQKLQRTGVVAFGAIAAGVTATLVKMGQLEQNQIAFTTMLGSAEKAKDLLADLSDFALKTPFELGGIRSTAKQLLAMGIEVDKLLPTMKALGDVSAGVGVDLGRVAYNFGQVKTQGKLTGVELKDFQRAGIPIITELAKVMGVAEDAIGELVSTGKVGFTEVEAAFTSMTSEGGSFANLMEAQSDSLLGRWSNLKDVIGQTAEVIGRQFLESAKGLISKLVEVMNKMSEWIQANPELAQKLIMVAAAIAGVLTVAGTLGLAIPALTAAFTALTGPVGIVIAAVAALGAILFKNRDKLGGFVEKLKEMWAAFKESPLMEAFRIAGEMLANVWENNLKPAFQRVGELLQKHKPLFELLGKVIGVILVGAISALVLVVAGLIKVFAFVFEWLVKIGAGLADFFMTPITWLIENIGVVGQAISQFFQDVAAGAQVVGEFFKGLFDGFIQGWNDMITWITTFLGKFIAFGEQIAVTINQVLLKVKAMFTEIGNFFKGMINQVITLFESMVNGVIKGLNFLIQGLNKIQVKIPDWVPKIGGRSFGVNISEIKNISIPRLAEGGIVTESTLANIGEAGPEAVIPLDKLKDFGIGGGGITVIIKDNSIIGADSRDIAERIGDQIMQTVRLNTRMSL